MFIKKQTNFFTGRQVCPKGHVLTMKTYITPQLLKFCPKCGGQLSQGNKGAEIVICSACEAAVAENWRYCAWCGEPGKQGWFRELSHRF